mgnify:FL=1
MLFNLSLFIFFSLNKKKTVAQYKYTTVRSKNKNIGLEIQLVKRKDKH